MTQQNNPQATDLLGKANSLLQERGDQYDRESQGDTFAPVASAMLQLSRGRINLQPKDVAMLLALVKITRSYSATSPETILDSYADGLAYLAKAGEYDNRILSETLVAPKPSISSTHELLTHLSEHHNIPEWATYLTLDTNHSVWVWEELPERSLQTNQWTSRVPESRFTCIARHVPLKTIVPQTSFIHIPKEYRNATQD